MSMNENSRSLYLDNLKLFLTLLVIFHLAGQAYGNGGGWAYTPSNTPTDSEQYDAPSDSTVIWSCIGVIAIIIGAFAIILSQETRDDLLNAIVMFFSVALSVGLLKITGVMSSKKKANKQDDDTSYYDAVNDCFNYESDDRND